MTYPKEQLKPVRSESELRAGMTVVVKDCRGCKRTHAYILAGRTEQERICLENLSPHVGWAMAAGCMSETCLHPTIAEGRLFRLDTGIDEEADARQAELDDAIIVSIARMRALRFDERYGIKFFPETKAGK